MKNIAGLISGFVCCFFICFLPPDSIGSDAFVSAEEEFGQGFFRTRGKECYFVTAGHVVEDATDIELTTSLRKNTEAIVLASYPSDIAILKVNPPEGEHCPESTWGDGKKLKSLLTVYKEGIIKTKLSDGSTVQTKVNIKSFDNFGYIRVTPVNPDEKFAKGFSGSPLYIAGQAAGMLLSVKKGVGKVFRQDALNNTLALFFESDGDEMVESTVTSPLLPNQHLKSQTHPKKQSLLA